ncbi:hypothetical protein SAMN05720764_10172 [Fibrobacter sp. UWH5]|uniref:AgmX/PglI C-terminal domain-containing protein n=1 Tax=Fibrobacter sp. UWH5 TaxID=1896211 RepID=UPI00091C72F3|nr:AgmX/PglI C-terminal domain-containing protein [Fibrobacter sp. UWH5]SHK28764.1 hypothetical protein SAMN05720764_10172 [Fibrobacter sp. UWH5]
MNKFALKFACGLIFITGLTLLVLAITGNHKKPRNIVRDYSVVPEGFAEQQKLANSNSSESFTGTVIMPTIDEISVHGNMEGGMAEIEKFMKDRTNGLNYIYKKFQKQNPGFEGSLSLDVTIDVCGDVVGMTEIASTTGYPRFNNEVKSSLSRQKYPKTTQGHYTLSFTLKFVNQVPVSEKGNVKPLPQSPADSVAEN